MEITNFAQNSLYVKHINISCTAFFFFFSRKGFTSSPEKEAKSGTQSHTGARVSPEERGDPCGMAVTVKQLRVPHCLPGEPAWCLSAGLQGSVAQQMNGGHFLLHRL